MLLAIMCYFELTHINVWQYYNYFVVASPVERTKTYIKEFTKITKSP